MGANTVVNFPRTYLPSAGSWRVPAGVTTADVLVQGAGGGGGTGGNTGYMGGGGGGGQFRYLSNVSLVPGANVPITVGGGGFGATYSGDTMWWLAQNGQPSSFGNYTAVGGGAGGSAGYNGGTATNYPAFSGASAGGEAIYRNLNATAMATASAGNLGGGGKLSGATDTPSGGGGGGAFSAGQTGGLLGAGAGVGGLGGYGKASAITGTNVYYGGGGNARGYTSSQSPIYGTTAVDTNGAAGTGAGG